MRKVSTRRALLGHIGGLAAAATMQAQAAKADVEGEDYYDKLGVPKIINAAGTYTILTASIMPPEVRAAVDKAARHPVRLLELQRKSGEYLARRLRCDAAMVTAGASSALTLGTAACIGLMNQSPIQSVPAKVAGLGKDEVIIQKGHRYSYDHAIENCGARFVEVESVDDYRKAFTSRTVMAHFFNAAEEGTIGREDWIRVAHQHGVPCFNDAAADVPPISNLWNYTQMGFDLVTFSGGKGIRGPQNAGLLLGRKDLIAAAAATNNPFDEGVGRGMKVAKEQIVGMVAAVDWFLNQSDEAMEAEFHARTDRICAELKNIPSLESRIVVPPVANHVPHLLLRYDQQRVKIAPLDVARQLRQGTPAIELNPSTGRREGSAGLPSDENTIVVGVWMLEPGEDAIVGRASLRSSVLSKLNAMKAYYRMELTIAPPDAEINRLQQQLRNYNTSQVGDSDRISLLITLLDSENEFAGGLFGKISRQWLFVDTLWIAERARGKGQGRELLHAAEKEARARGCGNAWVDTFSFQALSFYEKNGYVVFGELSDYPPGHKRYFLQKLLC